MCLNINNTRMHTITIILGYKNLALKHLETVYLSWLDDHVGPSLCVIVRIERDGVP